MFGRVRETLNKSPSGMKRKAHGAQEPQCTWKYMRIPSTAQRSDSLAQAFIQRFPRRIAGRKVYGFLPGAAL